MSAGFPQFLLPQRLDFIENFESSQEWNNHLQVTLPRCIDSVSVRARSHMRKCVHVCAVINSDLWTQECVRAAADGGSWGQAPPTNLSVETYSKIF